MTPAALVLALSVTAGPRLAAVRPAPEGWRLPTAEELGDDFRDESPDRFAVAHGDFDGDGRPDVARLMLSPEGDRAALVVSFGDGRTRIVALEERADYVTGCVRISVLGAGTHRTACGRGRWPCAEGEPRVLRMRWDGIEYFVDRTSTSVYYLPDRRAGFRRVWMSD